MLRRPQEGAEVQAAASLFDNAEVNRLIDENYERVQKDGWAELRIPQSIHHISRADFEPNALDAADKLCAAGYEVYIVGGSIRDIILGKSANDFDISRRDLTINALYYDIKTDEIVDWPGSLRDLRNGILDTLTDSDLTIRNVPPNAIRALRFKAGMVSVFLNGWKKLCEIMLPSIFLC